MTQEIVSPALAIDSERFSRTNPGPLSSFGTVRGTFITMLERFPLKDVRSFWKAIPILQKGRLLSEAEGYRFFWEYRGLVHLYYLEEVNESLMEFLLERGKSQFDFFNERHFRFEQGGVWSAQENLQWIKDALPRLYTDGEPKTTLLNLACEWAMRAVPGAVSQIPYFRKEANSVHAVFSFAPDGTFKHRCPFLFSRSTILGLKMFPRFVGLTPFDEARNLADCLHPRDLLRNVNWELSKGFLLIEGRRVGRTIRFSDWAIVNGLEFQGTPIPDRDVILMETNFKCPIRNIDVLLEGCVYDAPLFLATICYTVTHAAAGAKETSDYLKNIIEGLSLHHKNDWKMVEKAYDSLLEAVEQRLQFEFRPASQSILLNGKTLISGVPALILRKILTAFSKGQQRFDFRAFKHDPEIFSDFKRTSFETRWNRLQAKLSETTPHLRFEKIGKGEFDVHFDCDMEFKESP